MTKEDIMAADEMCDILHIKPNTMYSKRWRKLSRIPVFKQGKYLFSFKQDFWRWFKQRAIA